MFEPFPPFATIALVCRRLVTSGSAAMRLVTPEMADVELRFEPEIAPHDRRRQVRDGHLDADFGECLLQELLRLLTQIVAGGGGVGERQTHPVLRAYPIGSGHPAGLVEDLARALDVELLRRQVRIVVVGILRHEGLGGVVDPVINCFEDRFPVDCGVERLADRRVLELRLLKIEIERLDRCSRLQLDHTIR